MLVLFVCPILLSVTPQVGGNRIGLNMFSLFSTLCALFALFSRVPSLGGNPTVIEVRQGANASINALDYNPDPQTVTVTVKWYKLQASSKNSQQFTLICSSNLTSRQVIYGQPSGFICNSSFLIIHNATRQHNGGVMLNGEIAPKNLSQHSQEKYTHQFLIEVVSFTTPNCSLSCLSFPWYEIVNVTCVTNHSILFTAVDGHVSHYPNPHYFLPGTHVSNKILVFMQYNNISNVTTGMILTVPWTKDSNCSNTHTFRSVSEAQAHEAGVGGRFKTCERPTPPVLIIFLLLCVIIFIFEIALIIYLYHKNVFSFHGLRHYDGTLYHHDQEKEW